MAVPTSVRLSVHVYHLASQLTDFYTTQHCRLLLEQYKGKVYPRTGHEGPKGKYRYSSTLSLTPTIDVVGGNATPRLLYPLERAGTHCIRGWVGPRAGLDGCGKSRPHRDSITGSSIP